MPHMHDNSPVGYDNTLRTALIQTDIKWGDTEANLDSCDRIIRNIEDADLVVLPEMFTTGFMATGRPLSEPMDGNAVKWMRLAAADTGMAIAGSLIISDGNGRMYNRLIFAEPSGALHTYDKRHLFSFSGEDRLYERGLRRTIVEFKGFRILLQICYDLRFPVWSRNRGDYDVALYVASWPESRVGVWNTLLRARAMENQCYVLGVNRVGSDPTALYSGGSAAIDFYGNTLADLPDGCCGIVRATLDMNRLTEYRDRFRAWADADSFVIDG